MNHKGQVLVLFVLLLPILLLLASLIIDTGISYMEKRKIEATVKDTVSYALDHLDDDINFTKKKMTDLLNKNIIDIYDLKIDIQNRIVKIQIEKRIKTIFSGIGKSGKTIKLSYKGKLEGSKKQIKKE